MTELKDKSFLDWLFGSNGPPEAELALHLSEAHLRIEELQREIDQQRQSHRDELATSRSSLAEAEARFIACRAELELTGRELVAEKAARESVQIEVARLTRAAAEARATTLREAELRRKVHARCSSLELELDNSRSVLEAKSKREGDLDQELNQQRAACDDAQAVIASQRVDLFRCEERIRDLQHMLARTKSELAEVQAGGRTQFEVQQATLEQRQKELALARTDLDRLRHEIRRQKSSFEQASAQQESALEAERRAWGGWLGQVWNALVHSLGPAAPLALEASLGKLEPVAHANTTEAAEARLREFLSARSLCKNVAIHDEHPELRLELEPGPAVEGTAAGWLGIFATRYLACMLERPLRTRQIEHAGARLAVHATARLGHAEPSAHVNDSGVRHRSGTGEASPLNAEPS